MFSIKSLGREGLHQEVDKVDRKPAGLYTQQFLDGEWLLAMLVFVQLLLVLKSRVTGKASKQCLAKTPHVSRVGACLLGLAGEGEAQGFGGHEGWGSPYGRGFNRAFVSFAQPEVSQLDPPILRGFRFNEDVLGIKRSVRVV